MVMRQLAALFLLCAYGGGAWGEQECYVCRKDSQLGDDLELDKQFLLDDIPFCGREPDAKKVCPPDYSRGCYTETRGEKVLSKMCSGVEVSDCQEANNVNYCYCKGHLCNGHHGKKSDGKTPTTTLEPDTDDEDLSAGSGDGPGKLTTTISPRFSTTSSHPKGRPQSASPATSLFPSLLLPVYFVSLMVL